MKNKKNILCGAFAVLALSLAGGSLAFNANADEGVKTLDNISIDMVKGASMRIGSAEEDNSETTTGLRFTMKVSKAEYDAVDKTQYDSIEWGMLIAPVEYVTEYPLDTDRVFGKNAVYYAPESEEEAIPEGKKAVIKVSESRLTLASDAHLPIDDAENYYVFSGYMHSIKAENLTRGFVGRGYVKYTIGDNVQYILANYAEKNVENNTRSAYYVAAKYVAENEGTAAEYVKTTYLENETALKTAEVEVAAEDYMEDITIGTYAATPDPNNTVAVKIGETYDAANEEANKKEGYKLVSTSGTAEPLYRGQQLSIKRYYESNDYIPFSNTAGAVTKATADDGEDLAGAYKYSAGGSGLKFADYTNKKTDKILRDVNVPNDSSDLDNPANSKPAIVNYVTMKIRWAGGDFNYVSKLGDACVWDKESNKYWCVSMNWYSGSGTNGTNVHFYNLDGKRIFKVAANTWYTAAFPIITNYHDSARFGDAYLGCDSGQTVYFKDVKIENSATDPYDVLEAYSDYQFAVGSALSSLTDATEAGFENSKKFSTTSSEWNRGIMIANYDDKEGEIPAQQKNMINNGVRYITVNMYFTGAMTGFNYYDNIGKNNGLNQSVTFGTEFSTDYMNYNFNGTILECLRIYDSEGNRVYKVEKDTWYTVIMLTKPGSNGSWGKVWFHPNGQDADNAAVIYYNNLRYSCANPKA